MRTDTTDIGIPTVEINMLADMTMPMPRVTDSRARCTRCDIRLNAIGVPPVPYKGAMYHDVCAQAQRMRDAGYYPGALPSETPGTSDPR